MMKLFAAVVMILAGGCAWGQTMASFHNCRIDGRTGNDPHYQDMSEIYQCDEGRIELHGRWSKTIEYGSVFSTEMGRPTMETPHLATAFDRSFFKWCATPKPWDKDQKELCGLVPVKKCWDGKPPTFDSTGDWTCAGPEHGEALEHKEK